MNDPPVLGLFAQIIGPPRAVLPVPVLPGVN